MAYVQKTLMSRQLVVYASSQTATSELRYFSLRLLMVRFWSFSSPFNNRNEFITCANASSGRFSSPINSSMLSIFAVSGYSQKQERSWKYALTLHPLWHWSQSLARISPLLILAWHPRHDDLAEGLMSTSASWGMAFQLLMAYGIFKSEIEANLFNFKWR